MTRRVLVLTFDPVTDAMAGPAIRAWHLGQVLAAHGCEVTVASTVGASRSHPAMRVCAVVDPAVELAALAARSDVVFAPTSVVRRHADELGPSVPLVIDMYIPTHLENLEPGSRGAAEHEEAVAHQVSVINDDLARGDYFLCASERQRDFWLGALAHSGRVNGATYGDDPTLRRLIDVVPFGLPPDPPKPAGRVLRRRFPAIGDDDPVLVWGGGLYDWFDPMSLVRALDRARRTVPAVRLVFLGVVNPNPDIPEMAAARAVRSLSDALSLTDTTVFFNPGWIPYDQWGAHLLDADIGVSTHLEGLETRFSFRTRVLDYIWTRRPMILTGGDALGALIAERGLGRTVAPRDVDGLTDAIVDMASGGLPAPDFGPTVAELQWPVVAAPLLAWMGEPRRAPDRRPPP